MFSSLIDGILTRWSANDRTSSLKNTPSVRVIATQFGSIRVIDSGSTKPCIVFVPDGPNIIEHYEHLTKLLISEYRVVCFDMPGFGLSIPSYAYSHALDEGALAVLEVLNALNIQKATLAFSCANGFYAVRAAQIAPDRISSLFLAQTPSLEAMHAWTKRVVPKVLTIPFLGQVASWLFKSKAIHSWYEYALPKNVDRKIFFHPGAKERPKGACFCLAGVVQGLNRESIHSLKLLNTPCTMIWGAIDKSHLETNAESLLDCIPHAEIIRFDDCGHFPEIEQPERYVKYLTQHIARHSF